MSTPQGLAPRRTPHFTLDVGHQRFALGRQQLAHGAAVDFFLEGIAHHAVELHGTSGFIQTHVADVLRGSEMRQRTYQSITTRCFSAVSTGSVSVLSSVSRRLSM
jgi:hypothetical protein